MAREEATLNEIRGYGLLTLERKKEIIKRVTNAKDAARFIRSDRVFEFTGPQMEELSLAVSALILAFLETPNK